MTTPDQGPHRAAPPSEDRARLDPGDTRVGEAEPDGGISTIFIRRPVIIIMMMAGFLIVGVLAYFKLPIASLPTVNVATMLVTAARCCWWACRSM